MQKSPSIFTLKSAIIGIVLIPINYYWIIQMEVLRWSFPTYIVPFYNAIFSLLILISLNLAFKKFLRITFLNQGELIAIYTMVSAASALASINMMQVLVPTIGHVSWFATPENEWKELFSNYLPSWLTIDDKNVLRGYYNGDSSLFQIELIKAWLFPVISWSCFTCALILVMLCINIILKEQWSDREKLAYPIAQLPLEMTKESTFFKSKLMWIGFAVAGGIDIINGLGFIFPSIPLVNVKTHSIGHFFPSKPWNAMGWSMISFYPFAIGLGFLMPLSLAVSCWFFYILYKAELVISSALGLQMLPGFPYPNEQAFGAYIGIFLFAIWMGRRYFGHVIMGLFIKANKANTSYRKAIWGIIGGTIFLIAFSIKAGMTLWIAIVFFVVYFALAVAITRMRAELGFPVHDMHNMAPDYQLVTILGTRRLGPSILTVFSLYHWFNRTYASHPMPHQLEGFQMAENAGFNFKKLPFAIMIATAFGALAFFVMLLQTYYKLGAASGKCGYWTLGFGIETFNRLQWWVSYPTQTNYFSIIFMIIGFAFALFLMIMRMRFLWWTFHPLGYAVANSWGMLHIWFPLFLSSVAKWLVLKLWGIKAYRRVIMFFLGLILGEFIIGGLWNIVGIIFNIPTYQFWI